MIDPPRVHDLLVFVEQEINRVQGLYVRGVPAIASRLHQRVKEVHPYPAQLSAGFEKLLDLDGQDGAEEHRGDHDPLGGIHARAPPAAVSTPGGSGPHRSALPGGTARHLTSSCCRSVALARWILIRRLVQPGRQTGHAALSPAQHFHPIKGHRFKSSP